MSYQAEISRASPTAILMVMDQSTSMNHRLQSGQSKAAFLADVLNKTLYTIVANCSKADGVRDYFHLSVTAYSGGDAQNGFGGALEGAPLHAISELAEKPLRVETRTKKVAGLNAAIDVLEQWCAEHPSAYPPTILHVTDGHPSDSNPEPIADRLKGLATDDGGCLLFNLHLDAGGGDPLVFPN